MITNDSRFVIILPLTLRDSLRNLHVINTICDYLTVPWCFLVGDSSRAAEDDVVDRFDSPRFHGLLSSWS